MSKNAQTPRTFAVPVQSLINEKLGIYRGRKTNVKRKLTESDREEIIRRMHDGSVVLRSRDALSPVILRMAQAFANQRARYEHHAGYTFDWSEALEIDKRFKGLMSRAAAQAETLKASAEDYMTAQFFFFHREQGRAPMAFETASVYAISRYKAWKQLDKNEQVTATSAVTTSTPKITKKTMHAYEEHLLNLMIKQWGDEKKVWEMCGDEEDVFTEDFKKSRPMWNEIAKSR